MKTLYGRTVLLTGASSGLGPHSARRLHAEGALLVLSARHQDALERLAGELDSARVVVADLSLPHDVERLADEAGAVDILVANAGVPASGELVSFTVDQIDRALDVNLRAAMVLANRLLPGMLSRKSGHVVLMASMHSKMPTALVSVYNATKFGLRGFGLALGRELHGTEVGVSVINPTFITEAGMCLEGHGRPRRRIVMGVDPEGHAQPVQVDLQCAHARLDVSELLARADNTDGDCRRGSHAWWRIAKIARGVRSRAGRMSSSGSTRVPR